MAFLCHPLCDTKEWRLGGSCECDTGRMYGFCAGHVGVMFGVVSHFFHYQQKKHCVVLYCCSCPGHISLTNSLLCLSYCLSGARQHLSITQLPPLDRWHASASASSVNPTKICTFAQCFKRIYFQPALLPSI